MKYYAVTYDDKWYTCSNDTVDNFNPHCVEFVSSDENAVLEYIEKHKHTELDRAVGNYEKDSFVAGVKWLISKIEEFDINANNSVDAMNAIREFSTRRVVQIK